MQKWIFDSVGSERHTPLDQIVSQFWKLYSRVYQGYVKLERTTSN